MLVLAGNQQVLRSFYIGRRSSSAEVARRECLAESTVRSAPCPWNRAGVTPSRQIDLVLLDGDLALQVWDRRASTRAVRDGESSSSLLEAPPVSRVW